MSYAQKRVSAAQSTIVALSGVTTGTTTGGPSFFSGGPSTPEWDTLVADVSAAVKTSSLRIITVWQVSTDNSTFTTIYAPDSEAYVQVAADGTGTLVTTAYKQSSFAGLKSYPYCRLAIVSTGATGGASDNITIAYSYLKAMFPEN